MGANKYRKANAVNQAAGERSGRGVPYDHKGRQVGRGEVGRGRAGQATAWQLQVKEVDEEFRMIERDTRWGGARRGGAEQGRAGRGRPRHGSWVR